MYLGNFGQRIKGAFEGYVKYVSDSLYLQQTLVPSLIGIEINAEYIKLLNIHHNGNTHFRVDSFAAVDTPKNCIVNNEIKDPQTIAATIRELINSLNITTKQVALSIPRASAIIKIINVDSRLNVDEIESSVWIEANRLFPNLVGDIFLDFVVTGLSPDDKSKFDVVLVACRKEQINPYMEIMRLVGLVPALIDVDCYALERSLSILARQSSGKSTWALLNINFSMITLIVLHEGSLIYTHELSYDGHLLRDKIESDTDISGDELKSIILLHLRHALQFFYSSKPSVRFDEVVLAGDCAAVIPNLAAFIQQEIGKEVVLANPFKEMKMEPELDTEKINKDAPALMLCCGLAISKIKLE